MLDLTCAAMALRSSGNASRIAALGRMSKLNETVHPLDDVFPGGLVADDERGQLDQSGTVHPVRLGEAGSCR
jgi:hypothetical protein